MRTNPGPHKDLTVKIGHRPIMVSHTRRIQPVTSLQFFELERRMPGVGHPRLITAVSEVLNFRRQPTISRPEFGGCPGLHRVSPGQFFSVPAWRAASASAVKKSSLPAAAASSICRSHSSSRRLRIQSQSCRKSSFGSFSIATSTSCNVLMAERYSGPSPFSIINSTPLPFQTLNPQLSTKNQ